MSTIIDEGIWTDPWMQSLSAIPKLLFFYLWTNDHRNLACLYQISVKTMIDESGLNENEIRDSLAKLDPKVRYDWDNHICWVRSFVKRQFLRYGHISPKIVSGITKNLITLPQGHPFIIEFLDFYPELNIFYPHKPRNSASEKREPKTKKEKAESPLTPYAVSLAEYLWECIKQNRADRKLSEPKKPDLTKWAMEFDLMIRRDGRRPEDIRAVITWCQGDFFWWRNILSPSKLRDKFERLEAEMAEVGKPRQKKEKEFDDPYKDVPVIGANN